MLDLGTLRGFLELDSQAFDKSLDILPDKLKGSGVLMAAAAGAVAAAAGYALSKGLESAIALDGVQHTVQAQLGLTEQESARIGDIAGSLYADAYGESVEEVGTAITGVISSIRGMREASDAEVEAMTAKVLNISTAFEMDANRITQVTGQLLTTGLASSADEAVDLLTATFQRVPANVREDIVDAADEYGPFFASLGITGQEAFGLLASGAEQGMYGIDKAGDALKEFTIRATDLDDSGAQEALEGLGFSGEDMANKLLAGGDTARQAFGEIVAGLEGIDSPAEQSAAAMALFGTPLEDLGKDKVPTFLASLSGAGDVLGDVSGSAQEMGDALNGSVSVRFEALSRQFDALVGQVGTALLPILEAILDWAEANPDALTAVAVAVGVAAVAFGLLAAAMWVASLTPITLIIGAIILGVAALVAAIVWLVQNWDEVWAALSEGWQAFVDWITPGIEAFVLGWQLMWGAVGQFFTDVWNNFTTGVRILFEAWLTGVMIIVTTFVAGWNALWNGVGQFFTNIFTAFTTGASMIIGGFVGFVLDRVNSVVSFFQGLPGQIVGALSGAGQWLYESGRNIVQGLLDGVRSLAGTIGSFFLDLMPDWIVGPFKAALGINSPSRVFAEYGRNIADGVIVGVNDREGAIDERMTSLVNVPETPAMRAGVGAGGAMGAADVDARFMDLTEQLGDLAQAVREARPITVTSHDTTETVLAVGEALR